MNRKVTIIATEAESTMIPNNGRVMDIIEFNIPARPEGIAVYNVVETLGEKLRSILDMESSLTRVGRITIEIGDPE